MNVPLHSIGLADMKEIVENGKQVLGERDMKRLAKFAKDFDTMVYLFARQHKVNLTQKESGGVWTPLQHAAHEMDFRLVEFLSGFSHENDELEIAIEAAIRGFVNPNNNYNRLPTYHQEGRSLSEIVKLLIKPDMRIKLRSIFTLIDNRLRFFIMQLRNGTCDVPSVRWAMKNLQAVSGMLTPLREEPAESTYVAAQQGDIAFVKQAWQREPSTGKEIILSDAIERGYLDICKFCLETDPSTTLDAIAVSDAALSNPDLAVYLVKHIMKTSGYNEQIARGLEMAIARDITDSLGAMMHELAECGLKLPNIRCVPVVVVSTCYMAKKCFKFLLDIGLPPFYMYPDQYYPSHKGYMFSMKFNENKNADEEFFLFSEAEDCAMKYNNKAMKKE